MWISVRFVRIRTQGFWDSSIITMVKSRTEDKIDIETITIPSLLNFSDIKWGNLYSQNLM